MPMLSLKSDSSAQPWVRAYSYVSGTPLRWFSDGNPLVNKEFFESGEPIEKRAYMAAPYFKLKTTSLSDIRQFYCYLKPPLE